MSNVSVFLLKLEMLDKRGKKHPQKNNIFFHNFDKWH